MGRVKESSDGEWGGYKVEYAVGGGWSDDWMAGLVADVVGVRQVGENRQ